MAQKQKRHFTLSPVVIKTAATVFVTAALIVFLYRTMSAMIFHSDFFTVKSITMDSSLDFIDTRDLARLKGRSIFDVDLKEAQRRLSLKYPQTFQLRVERRFPDQIRVTAQKRMPFAEAILQGRIYIVDEAGVFIGKADQDDPQCNINAGSQVCDLKWIDGDQGHLVAALGYGSSSSEKLSVWRYRKEIESIQKIGVMGGFEGYRTLNLVKDPKSANICCHSSHNDGIEQKAVVWELENIEKTKVRESRKERQTLYTQPLSVR